MFRSRGEVVLQAAGGAVVGDPPVAVAWLVNTLAARGERLSAGSGVLSGGRTASVVLRPGPNVVAEIDGRGDRSRLPAGRSTDGRCPGTDRVTVTDVTISPYDVRVGVRGGETILGAIVWSGYKYRYGCRRGGCGLCKVHLVLGEVHYERPIAASVLSDDERCRAVPITNVVIELQEGDRLRGAGSPRPDARRL